ncbi:MAG TPA: heavy-metal-associated domain-containing protein [Dehalococcoidia bacterium]|nr:heavy-metal-associated domain-containing protein [Dehalococcoidia bacterium]
MMRIKLSRLFRFPSASVIGREGDVTRVRVEGLVCDRVCAMRAQRALASLDGVREVHVDFARGEARVRGAPHEAGAYEAAVRRVVLGKPLRRALERVAHVGRREAA